MNEGWISVKEKLPNPHLEVAVLIEVDDIRFVHIAWLDYSGVWQDDWNSWPNKEITHWTTLPTLPEINET